MMRSSGIGNGRVRMRFDELGSLPLDSADIDSGNEPHADVLESEFVDDCSMVPETPRCTLINQTTCRETFGRGTFNRGTFGRGTYGRGTFGRGTFGRGSFHNAEPLVIKRISFHPARQDGDQIMRDSHCNRDSFDGDAEDVGRHSFDDLCEPQDGMEAMSAADLAMFHEDTSSHNVGSSMRDAQAKAHVPHPPVHPPVHAPVSQGTAWTGNDKRTHLSSSAHTWSPEALDQASRALEEVAKSRGEDTFPEPDSEPDAEPDADVQCEASTSLDISVPVVVGTTASLKRVLSAHGRLPSNGYVQALPLPTAPADVTANTDRASKREDSPATRSCPDAPTRPITPNLTAGLPAQAASAQAMTPHAPASPVPAKCRSRARMVTSGWVAKKNEDAQDVAQPSASANTQQASHPPPFKIQVEGDIAIDFIKSMLIQVSSTDTSLQNKDAKPDARSDSKGYPSCQSAPPAPKSQADLDEEASLCYSSCGDEEQVDA